MNIQDTLKYAKVDEHFSKNIYYGLTELLERLNVMISVDQELYEQNNSDMSLKLHNVHEFSVDHHHCGYTNFYTFKDQLFACSYSVHEDSVYYEINNKEVFGQFMEFIITCMEVPEEKQINEIKLTDIPLLQIFSATFNIYGDNLLYVEDDGKFTLIEKAWQDRDEINADHADNRRYEDMYYYKYYEIITGGVQRRVQFKRIVSVIGDNAELAKFVSENKNFNDPEFEFVYSHCGRKQIGPKE